LCSSKLSFGQNQLGVRGFDPGENRSTLEPEVLMGQAFALIKAGVPGSHLRVVPGALRHAALEIGFPGELSSQAKEAARNVFPGEFTGRKHSYHPEI
jgi:hypothetical protein